MKFEQLLMTRLLISLLMMIPMFAGAVAVKDVENVHVKNRTRYVTDMAGMLSPQAVARIDSLMADAWRQSSAEPVVVIVDNLDGEDIDDYATELFELWKPGKKDNDNGVILLISRDDRKFVIRTGYGVEGVLPDALCWTILNQTMKPYFQQGDYDGGVVAAATDLNRVLTDEEARAELMSKYKNDSEWAGADDFFKVYLSICLILLVAFAVYYFCLLVNSRGKDTAEAYHLFEKNKLAVMVLTAATLGIMAPVLIAWLLTMRHIRTRRHLCSNCSTPMTRLDEETDNKYLTPAQDAEERLNSVDYDVWLCPTCNQTEIIPFINRQKNYSVCHVCGARTAALVSDRITRQPTTMSFGQGVKTYRCFNCHNMTNRTYQIPKVVAPPVILGGGGRGFGGGGGFSGGSFGGGMTGGGGSRGGW